jgi:hypothetical protein
MGSTSGRCGVACDGGPRRLPHGLTTATTALRAVPPTRGWPRFSNRGGEAARDIGAIWGSSDQPVFLQGVLPLRGRVAGAGCPQFRALGFATPFVGDDRIHALEPGSYRRPVKSP